MAKPYILNRRTQTNQDNSYVPVSITHADIIRGQD